VGKDCHSPFRWRHGAVRRREHGILAVHAPDAGAVEAISAPWVALTQKALYLPKLVSGPVEPAR